MKSTFKCIYSYYETLLGIWNTWNDGILYGQFPEGANSFTEALGMNTSDGRSRAKEIYRIGLLRKELTKGTSGLDYIAEGNNIQSDLGYVSALIAKAASLNRTESIDKALSAICSIFSIIQSVKIDDIEFSINTLIQHLNKEYPCPEEIDFRKWHRYILSAFFCETKYREDIHKSKQEQEDDSRSFIDFFTGQGGCPPMTIRMNEKNGYAPRIAIKSVQDVMRSIIEKVSLTDIIQQKSPLFIFGDEKDKNPKGFYGMAFKHNSIFLRLCYELEINSIQQSPFLGFYDEESSNSAKGNSLNQLKMLFEQQNDNIKSEFQHIMKSIYEGALDALGILKYQHRQPIGVHVTNDSKHICAALRTKPFLLLAGISGTGKSRIVRELAFKSCPKYLQDKDGTTPGNYCMIEVKPNWHDSTELLGYYSNLSKSYQFKKFVKFLVKAKMSPDVPFFVCLDEMNLAPVEQYFAEILSVLETRKHPQKEGGEVDMSTIKTGVIVEGKYFSQIYQKDIAGVLSTVEKRISDGDWYASFFKEDQMTDAEKAIVQKNRSDFSLCDEGLSLPDNVIIIGTVNMDDTTHQFSRKVIDRAMTIEMNGGKLKNMFGGSKNLAYLKEEEQKKWQTAFKQNYVSADEVLAAHADKAEDIVNLLPEKLESINAALKGTPFEVSYRVLNELTIMVGVMLDNSPEEELETIVDKALDRILLMKILPRIEGDSEMFNLKESQTVGNVTYHNRLEWLRELAPAITLHEDEGGDHQQTAKEKIEEMIERLDNQEFTRFWP